MNQTQQELTYYKALRTAWTKQARVLESATKTLDKIIKKMEREEPRFLLDKDSVCYGCPEYKNIMDCDLTDPWNHWGEGDGNGGVCDTEVPCYDGDRNTYKKRNGGRHVSEKMRPLRNVLRNRRNGGNKKKKSQRERAADPRSR